MKLLILSILSISLVASTQVTEVGAHKTLKNRPWIFFDLGDTILNTEDKSKMEFYPGALTYLNNLKEQGYLIGVITNIPEKFGKNYDEKVTTLKKYVSSKWTGKEKLNWDIFDKVIIPMSDAERKPALKLFNQARALSGNCPTIFMGENQKEVEAAASLGINTFQVGQKDRSFYLPKGSVDSLMDTKHSTCLTL